MHHFDVILERAVARKGGRKSLDSLLPAPKTSRALMAKKDHRYLSDMSRRVFRAGLKHSMVDSKWPAFEARFFGFEPDKVILISDERLEQMMQDTTIIRHFGKLKTVRKNAQFVLDIGQEYGSFGRFIARWPESDIIGLWRVLAKQGTYLGGRSASAFLRMVGKDTFLLTEDVVAALKAQGVVDRAPTAQRDLRVVQEAFNQWREQSGLALCQISRILSFTVGDSRSIE
ncbi:MAG: 3-methyladenine DNA glycosylase [Gammaproteobacteria bacterium]|nr:MAG: 3-methyladenine DNA glycosylase [Gammaproteobacteria bacterium]